MSLFLPGAAPSAPAPAARRYGGKAAGLLRLRALGLPVPEFVVLPAALFAPLLAGLPTTAAGLAERGRRLASFTLPGATQAALQAVLANWDFPARPVVVRSSVVDEDGSTAAFPGLMDSVLHVTDWAALAAAVAQVAASAYSERALAYRRQLGLPLAAQPAVVVQRQVAARAAGVLFSTLPEYPREVAIHAVPGLADGLVNGQLVPEEYYLAKASGQLVQAPPAGLLDAPALAHLHALSQQLEQALGHPQDVEWAQDAGGQLWLVQTRPLTQPVPEVVVYDNANIQESYCGVTTPLTFSFAQRAYATVYRQTMRTLGLPAATVAAYEPVVANLLALREGRIYYHLNHWYQGLQLLPKFSERKADMERMMGVLEPVDFVHDQRKSLRQRLALLPRLAANLGCLLWAFSRLPARAAAFQHHCEQAYQRFYRQPLAGRPAAALLAEIDYLDAQLLHRWTVPILNDFRVMMANGRAGRCLAQAGLPHPEDWLSCYLSGQPSAATGDAAEPPLASLLPTLALRELAATARRDYPALLPLLQNPSPAPTGESRALGASQLASPDQALGPGLPAEVARLAPGFHQLVQGYVARYGDRTMGELKLETRTMRTDEALFYDYLRPFLAAPRLAPESAPEAVSLAGQARAELAARLAGRPQLARRTWAALTTLHQAVARRETLRLERTRLFGMYRAAYRALGQHLAQAGTLAAPDDVFYLTESEIRLAATQGGTEWRALVAGRQAEFAGYRAAPAPPGRLYSPGRPWAPPAPPAAGELRGTGCYPGQVRGAVVVITDPAQANVAAVQGHIVAALRTDPGWAPLFPGCRAVLIERGSALSHSVILLRELGIPTIINIEGLTQALQTGQVIEVDGRTGAIVVSEEAPASS